MKTAGVVPESHAAKAGNRSWMITHDELLQVDTATLTEHALGILRLQERQRAFVLASRSVWSFHFGPSLRATRSLQH